MGGILEKYGVLYTNPDTGKLEITENIFKEFLKKIGLVCKNGETDLPVALGGQSTVIDAYSQLLDLNNPGRFKDFQDIMRQRLTDIATCINNTKIFGNDSTPAVGGDSSTPTPEEIANIGLVDITAIEKYFNGEKPGEPKPIQKPTEAVEKYAKKLAADGLALQTILSSPNPPVAAQTYVNQSSPPMQISGVQLLTGIAQLIQARDINENEAIGKVQQKLQKEQDEQKAIEGKTPETPEKYKQDKKYIDLQKKIEEDLAKIEKLKEFDLQLKGSIETNVKDNTVFKFMRSFVEDATNLHPEVVDTLEEFVFEKAVDIVLKEYLSKWLGLAKTSKYIGFGAAADAYATNTSSDGGIELVPAESINQQTQPEIEPTHIPGLRSAISYSVGNEPSIRQQALGHLASILGDWTATIKKNFDVKDYPGDYPGNGAKKRGRVYVLKDDQHQVLKQKIADKRGGSVELYPVKEHGYPSYKTTNDNPNSTKLVDDDQYARFKLVYGESWVSDDDKNYNASKKAGAVDAQKQQYNTEEQKSPVYWTWTQSPNANSSSEAPQFDKSRIKDFGTENPTYAPTEDGTYVFDHAAWNNAQAKYTSNANDKQAEAIKLSKETPSSTTGCNFLPGWVIRRLKGDGSYKYKAKYPPGSAFPNISFSIAGGGNAQYWGYAYNCWIDATTDGLSTDSSTEDDKDGKQSARDSLNYDPVNNEFKQCQGRRPRPGDILYMATTQNHEELHHAAMCIDGYLDGLFCDQDGNPLMITADGGAGTMKNENPVKIVYYARYIDKQSLYSLTPFWNQENDHDRYDDSKAAALNNGFVAASPSLNDPEWGTSFTRTFVGWCNLETIDTIIK
jgi:transcription elongation factor Elf1